MIDQHPESRFPGDREYGFRHGLVREAAYGLLTDDDKKLGRALVPLIFYGAPRSPLSNPYGAASVLC